MESATIKITGMTCMGCVRSVTNVLQALPGVTRADVSLEHGEARVEYDSATMSTIALKAVIMKAGFEAN